MYAIIKKDKSSYFAGFSESGKALWTTNKNKAWTSTKVMASCQSNLLKDNDSNVQLKPVFLENIDNEPVAEKVIETVIEKAEEVSGKDKSEVELAIELKTEVMKSIDKIVLSTKGTWVKHRNLRAKLTKQHNDALKKMIEEVDIEIAKMRSMTNQDKREIYKKKALLSIMVI